MPIQIHRGQSKTILMEYFQEDVTGPTINLTGALFSIHDANYPAQATFQEVDLATGKVNLMISSEGSEAMVTTRINWMKVKVAIGSWEDVSGRIEFEVLP